MKPVKFLVFTVGGDGVMGDAPMYDVAAERVIALVYDALRGIGIEDPAAAAWWQGRLAVIIRDAAGTIVWRWLRGEKPEYRAALRRLEASI